MKHIKKIDELFKSTYMNAAKKLDGGSHSHRADKLKDWGKEKGIPQRVDRLSPHRFLIRFSGTEYMNQHDNEYYSLVKTYYQPVDNTHPFKYRFYKYIGFNFISNYNNKVTLYLGYIPNADVVADMKNVDPDLNEYDGYIIWGRDTRSDKFQVYKFKDRKDAVEFKKAAIDFVSEEKKSSSNNINDPEFRKSLLISALNREGLTPFSGEETCEFCQGHGTVNCPECDGMGSVEVEDESGETDYQNCEFCGDEDGVVTCPECMGEGQIQRGNGNVTGYYDENEDICELDEEEADEMINNEFNRTVSNLDFLSKLNINSMYTTERNEVERREEDKAVRAALKAKANPPLVGFGSYLSKKR